jgi:hypothetical protein
MNKHDFARGFMCGAATFASAECLRVGYINNELGMGVLMAAGWSAVIVGVSYASCLIGRLVMKKAVK